MFDPVIWKSADVPSQDELAAELSFVVYVICAKLELILPFMQGLRKLDQRSFGWLNKNVSNLSQAAKPKSLFRIFVLDYRRFYACFVDYLTKLKLYATTFLHSDFCLKSIGI